MRLLSIMIAMAVIIPSLSPQAFAGAALMQAQRAKQMKAQQEAQAQAQAAQQYQEQMAMQQNAEVQAAQAQLAQQQMIQVQMQQMIAAYIQQQRIQQVEQALAMKYLQEELRYRMQRAQIQQIEQVNKALMEQAVVAAVQRATAERVMASRNAQAAKQYIESRNDAIKRYGDSSPEVAAYMSAKNKRTHASSDDMIQQIVGANELYAKLDENAQAWRLIIDNQAKVMTVNEYIERFRREKVVIGQPPSYYAHMIDEMSQQNPQLLNRPFKDIIQLLAVMDYDFDVGMDRDLLARKVLGESMYLANRKRLGR